MRNIPTPNRDWANFKAMLQNTHFYEQNEITVQEAWDIFIEMQYCKDWGYPVYTEPNCFSSYMKDWFDWQDEYLAEGLGRC